MLKFKRVITSFSQVLSAVNANPALALSHVQSSMVLTKTYEVGKTTAVITIL